MSDFQSLIPYRYNVQNNIRLVFVDLVNQQVLQLIDFGRALSRIDFDDEELILSKIKFDMDKSISDIKMPQLPMSFVDKVSDITQDAHNKTAEYARKVSNDAFRTDGS